MKILRLVIKSFGNQVNKVVDFSGDTNVIMGTDSSAINMIRTFMDGMLFGLSNEDKNKYRPNKPSYAGTLIFENDEGEQIQIDRNFLNGAFMATDIDGNDVTEDYTDEYGNLMILPVSDSVFAREVIKGPETTEADDKKLNDLLSRKQALDERYNIGQMYQELDDLKEKLSEQEEIERELDYNQQVISQNEKKVQAISGNTEMREQEINQEILSLKSESQKVEVELNKLKNQANTSGTGKAQVLRRDKHNNDQRIEALDRKITGLEEEEKLYSEKLDELKQEFTVDRNELKEDFDKYQEDIKRQQEGDKDPLVQRLIGYSTWIYAFFIICGILAVAIVLYNPNDTLTRVPIYFISFISVFTILASAVIIYLQIQEPVAAVPVSGTNTAVGVTSKRIISKYHQENPEDFENFFNDAKKLYNRMDDLEADLHDIRTELADAKEEKKQLETQQHDISIDLSRNKTAYENTDIDDKIFELTKQRNAINAQIDELIEERQDLQNNSIWKLKEESMILDEKNKQLLMQDNGMDVRDTRNQYEKLQKQIDKYEKKAQSLDEQIAKAQEAINGNRMNYFNSYATPGEVDYDLKIAEQFGFGLQHNLSEHNLVPYITYNPFEEAGDLNSELMDKFKQFIENKQALIFTTDFEDLDRLTENNIKYNGIFIR